MSEFQLNLLEVLLRIAVGVETIAGNMGPKREPDAWKGDPVTDKQKSFMTEKLIPFKEGISKGEASEKIDHYIQAKKKGA